MLNIVKGMIGPMCRRRRKPNRKYSFESLMKRVKEAQSEAEIDVLSDLLDELAAADLVTAYQYRELDCALDQRLCDLVLEGKA